MHGMLYGRTLSVIMLCACMIIIIVIDDGNVEYKDRQSRPGQDVSATCVLYVCTAPFSQCFSLTPLVLFVLLCTVLLGRYSAGWMYNPACSVCSVVYDVARQVLCWMDN